MTKYGGNLGENGSVAWMFDKKGQIVVEKGDLDEDSMFEIVVGCGAEDFEAEEDEFIVVTEPADLMDVRDRKSACRERVFRTV